MTDFSDSEIIHLCQAGDKHAFGLLVKKYMKRAYFSALSFVHKHDIALDISQEAFVKAWRNIKTIDTKRPFFTWYYTILKNLSLNEIRNLKTRAKNFTDIWADSGRQIEIMQYDNTGIEREELQEQVWKAINLLEADEREIILLREFQDLSYNEIAEILQCPVGTVMSRL